MNQHIINKLRCCETFSSLAEIECEQLLSSMEHVTLRAGELLFEQDAEQDGLYVVLHGHLSVLVKNQDNGFSKIGEIHHNETIGELGVISNKPRTATVVAMRKCHLLKLPAQAFNELCSQQPEVLRKVCAATISRFQHTVKALSHNYKMSTNIAIIPVSEHIKLEEFLQVLYQKFQIHKKIKVVRFEEFFADNSALTLEAVEQQLSQFETDYDVIFFECKLDHWEWSKIGIEHAQQLLVVGRGNRTAHYHELVSEILLSEDEFLYLKKDLVLFYTDYQERPLNTIQWLKKGKFNRHFHVRLNKKTDIAYFYRVLTNQATGLVLSGGGARAWSEVGAIKAYLTHGGSIDMLGGTSAGALISATVAASDAFEDWGRYQSQESYFAKMIKFNDYTIPFTSILSGYYLTRLIKELCLGWQIEDLWRPYFCISADPANAGENIHTTGSLWQAVRSSLSIPGIFPPMLSHHGKLIVDGAVINNLPTDVMKHQFYPGKVFAIDVSMTSHVMRRYNFSPSLRIHQVIAHLFSLRKSLPNIINIVMNSMLASAAYRAKDNIKYADIYLKIPVETYGALDSSKRDQLIEIGFQEMLTCLRNHKLL